MDAVRAETKTTLTTFVREIIVVHHPYRSLRSKNKKLFPYWTGDEHYAHLVVFLKTASDDLVFLRRIGKLDCAKVSRKIAMMKKVYSELIDLALVPDDTAPDGAKSFGAETPLPIWMEVEDYRELKARHNSTEK
ncbi:MAG: hypothetical protein A2845_04040 [Candidatus Lloydbacteria bacterium RIFCSPHIGHO2_01_FULL_49_22]|uniref:Uncharacterized protein n=1 Tax=Candidatus Lloydbacteria bacterium RIFCSPHIGHO2_01_FULL_49_22 TaxID=1798658 RepID=A0A1G2CX64_9BACT|nr:MAG: hypothetical protein A2845_04040 [Candidatus Lloydbacteria bacterium RIFCSPHIGHO2_01_FULL_49_22]OGZ09097.1 MAG: hypothetical protein A3C14_03875 [Candidatus Lloydbacteria bacterium RIFCSPHIGHO2_02_FULL_50_18]